MYVEMAKITLCVLQDKDSFSRLLVAGVSRTDIKLSFFQMNRMRERCALAVAEAHRLTVAHITSTCIYLSLQPGNSVNL